MNRVLVRDERKKKILLKHVFDKVEISLNMISSTLKCLEIKGLSKKTFKAHILDQCDGRDAQI